MLSSAALLRPAVRPWWIVAGLSLWSAVALGTTIGSLGIFVEPIRQEFGWTGEQIGRALTAFVLAMALIMPAVGLLTDRIGARLVMTGGVAVIGVSYLLAGWSQMLAMLVAALAAAGAGIGASTYLPCTVVISGWFSERRGLALGVLLAASAVGATVFPVLIAPMVLDHGWRQVMTGIASLNLLIGLPLVLALARRGPYGSEEQSAASSGRSLVSLMRARTFWLVTLVLILSQLSFFGIYFHLIAFLTSLGFPETTAVLFYSGSALATFVGAMILGLLIDRLGARPVLIAALMVLVFSCLLLPAVDVDATGIAAGIAFAVLWGAVVNSPYQFAPILLADVAGVASLGALLGIGNFLTGLISSLGPVLTGAIYDATHSYIAAFILAAGIAALALVPALLLPRRPPGR